MQALSVDDVDYKNYYTPEQRLLCGMLIRCYSDLDMPHYQQVYRETTSWVRDKSRGPFSFYYVCTELDLDWKTVRRKMLDLIKKQI